MSEQAVGTHRAHPWVLTAAVAPPLLLAGLGLLHPHELDDGTAARWTGLHLVLLPVFPLLALAPWLVARRGSRVAGGAALLLGFVFAVFYTALDLLAGVATGVLQQAGETGGIRALFRTGNALSLVGVYAYLGATVLAAGVALRRARLSAVPGAVVVVLAAVSFLGSHVYWPAGVVTMLALAVGWGLLLAPPRWGGRASPPVESTVPAGDRADDPSLPR